MSDIFPYLKDNTEMQIIFLAVHQAGKAFSFVSGA